MRKPTKRAKPWLTEEGLLKVGAWCRDGLSDEQIAKNMGVAYSTFRKWRDDYVALSAVLKKNKEIVDIEVENKLYERAMGFHYEETKTYIEEVDGVRKIRQEKYKRYAVPDTTAQIFWLKNRKPRDWRNNVIIEDDRQIDKLDKILLEFENASNS